MTLLNEAAETDQGLEDYLAADSTLTSLTNGIFSTFIGTTSTPMPIVRFTLVESSDSNMAIHQESRVWVELVYQVEAITDGPESVDAAEIAQRIDELLHGQRGLTWGNVFIEEIYRREGRLRKEVEGGDPFVYAGGDYVFHVSAP